MNPELTELCNQLDVALGPQWFSNEETKRLVPPFLRHANLENIFIDTQLISLTARLTTIRLAVARIEGQLNRLNLLHDQQAIHNPYGFFGNFQNHDINFLLQHLQQINNTLRVNRIAVRSAWIGGWASIINLLERYKCPDIAIGPWAAGTASVGIALITADEIFRRPPEIKAMVHQIELILDSIGHQQFIDIFKETQKINTLQMGLNGARVQPNFGPAPL